MKEEEEEKAMHLVDCWSRFEIVMCYTQYTHNTHNTHTHTHNTHNTHNTHTAT